MLNLICDVEAFLIFICIIHSKYIDVNRGCGVIYAYTFIPLQCFTKVWFFKKLLLVSWLSHFWFVIFYNTELIAYIWTPCIRYSYVLHCLRFVSILVYRPGFCQIWIPRNIKKTSINHSEMYIVRAFFVIWCLSIRTWHCKKLEFL